MKQTSTHALQTKYVLKLKSSGLSLKHAKKLRMKILTRKNSESLGVQPYEGFKIPYFDLKGKETEFFRVRYLESTKQGFHRQTSKKEQRYAQPPETLNEAYIPPLMNWENFVSTTEPLIITEGELKAAAATARGFPAIGLGGVDCFRSSKRGISLLPIFKELRLKERVVYVIYDSDAAQNPNVAAAEAALCRELTALGAVPIIVRLPNILADGKTGLDDFLLETSNEDFESLLEEAQKTPYKLAAALHQMNEKVLLIMSPACIYEMRTGIKMSRQEFTEHNYANWSFVEYRVSPKGDIKTIKTRTAKAWLEWPFRAQVEGLVYEPGLPEITDDGNLNLWKGWPYQPIKGDVSPWKKLFDFVFDGLTKEEKTWVEQWMAYPMQHPGTKLFSAVVVWGLIEGSGKTLLGYTLKRLYGVNADEISNTQLESDDNDYAENKQFIVGEEISGGDKRGTAEKIRSLITRETVRVNIKYVAKYTIRDCINYYFTSNNPDAFYIRKEDRRMFVHEVKHTTPMAKEFYSTVYDPWYKSKEGMSALFHYLLNLDLTGFEPYAPPPMTLSKKEMIDQGLSELDNWVATLKEHPDTALQINGKIIPYAMYRAEELLHLFAPDGARNLSTSGLARALKRAGFQRAAKGFGCRCAQGQYKLWIVRDIEKYKDLSTIKAGEFYDSERALPKPKFTKK